MKRTITRLGMLMSLLAISSAVFAQSPTQTKPIGNSVKGGVAPIPSESIKPVTTVPAELNVPETSVNAPGFPVYQNTGNPEQDQLNYAKAKDAWINANPKAYAQEIDELETQSTPATGSGESVEMVSTPINGFQPSGNPSTYEAEKKEWISANPAAYSNSIEKADNYSKVDLPGFPVFVNTGNPELDNANYKRAKQEWISNNQELYNSQFTRSTETKEQSENN
jgi:hypothetical protein